MKIFVFLLFLQTYNPDIAQIIQRVNVDSVSSHILRLQNFWTRHYKTDSMYKARLWIKSKFESYSLNVNEYIFFYPDTLTEQANIIATKYGLVDTLNPIVLCAHYDSRGANWGNPPYGPAPGADDNASGVSFLLEIARIIKDIDFDYTIKFIAFACEEPGLIGSYRYSNYFYSKGGRMKYLFNADMIGGDGSKTNNIVIVERDQGNQNDTNDVKSYAFADTLSTMYSLYTTLSTTYGNIFASDYMPFEAYGYTTFGVFEYNFSSVYHSAYDVIDSLDVDYATEIIKGALAFILHTAKFHPVKIAERVQPVYNKIKFVKTGFYDITGRKKKFYGLKRGIYFIINKEGKSKKIIKIR